MRYGSHACAHTTHVCAHSLSPYTADLNGKKGEVVEHFPDAGRWAVDIDGVLVGGASLEAESFARIANYQAG